MIFLSKKVKSMMGIVEHINALSEKYPNSRDVTIIIDDIQG